MRGRTPEPERRLGIDDAIVAPDKTVLLRLEEEADVHPGGWGGVGFLRAKKHIETVRVDEDVTRDGEEIDLERLQPAADDPGGVLALPDGGISIPIYEEEVVVTTRVVLKERVVIRKRIETHVVRVKTELRREQIEITADESLQERVSGIEPDEGDPAHSR